MRNREPGPTRAQQQNGQPETAAPDDDRFRDHHIEEMLRTFTDAARMRENGSMAGEEQLD